MAESDGSLKKKVEVGFGEIIILSLILIDILEFMNVLPYELNYVNNVVEWIGLIYLLYQADLTEIFFGYKDKKIDALLILSYFLYSFLVPLYTFIMDHAYELQTWTFYAGAILLMIIATLNLFLNFEVKKPSIMAMMHEEGRPADFMDRLKRTITSFMIFVFFFIFVFNLMMEWLAWAVESSITVIAIFVYIFLFIKYSKRLKETNIIYKIGDSTSDFYTNFVKSFQERATIMTGVTGILVLHLLTDGGIFVLPYILNSQIKYFADLGVGHETILALARESLAHAGTWLAKGLVMLGYSFNSIAAVLLFLGPAFIWYGLYSRKKMHIPKIVYFLFFSSVSYLILNPVLGIKRLSMSDIVGVDIFTKSLPASDVNSMIVYSAIALAIGAIAFAMRYNNSAKRIVKWIAFSGTGLLFCYYIMLYSIDIIMAYWGTIVAGAPSFILFYYVIFLIATFFFYFGGGLYFVYMSLYNLHKKEV
ncbi:MAG: hypothetical protein NT001_05765 [Candidatus Woesearchaeota archaeon]|nr:hypothetical protein [Candidatus Woesearchaeota archaeon]